MSIYSIQIVESVEKIVEVEADNVGEACLKVTGQYESGDIILDEYSNVETSFNVLPERVC